jgi:hypothetical protein
LPEVSFRQLQKIINFAGSPACLADKTDFSYKNTIMAWFEFGKGKNRNLDLRQPLFDNYPLPLKE